VSTGIELERVVRVGPRGRPTGKIHLTALVPEVGEVRTLCGKRFPVDGSLAVEEPADCQPCLRRSHNPSLVSAALFEAGLGSKLLELSVAQAGERTQEPEPTPDSPLRVVRPTVVRTQSERPPTQPPGEPAERPGELRLRGLKQLGPDLFRSPAGVLIRLRQSDDGWYVAELDFDGSVLIRRRSPGRFELRVGDVDIVLDTGGAIRAAYSVR
jgi:hypothetical protein